MKKFTIFTFIAAIFFITSNFNELKSQNFAKKNQCLSTKVEFDKMNGKRKSYKVTIQNKCPFIVSWAAESYSNDRYNGSASFVSGNTSANSITQLSNQSDDQWIVYECPKGFKLSGSHRSKGQYQNSQYNCSKIG